jgi:hypothetical protein
MAVDRLQHFLDVAAYAPPERDARHFRAWQKVSVQVQREVRSLVATTFFAEEWRSAVDLERAFTNVVYTSCQPCYGRRPMEFTYDICELAMLSAPLRLIGRSMRARLTLISAGFQSNPQLKRRFLPVWHYDILNTVLNKPRTLIKLLAHEAIMINALINLGTRRDERTGKLFLKSILSAARLLGVDSTELQDLVLRTAIENLSGGRIFKDAHMFTPGSPDARIGGDENCDHGSPYGGGQVADAGIVSNIQACG